MMDLKTYKSINDVLYLTPKQLTFSNIYIAVRDKEKRFLTDEEVLQLPYCSNSNPHLKEWELRQESTQRFINYINKFSKPKTILEIGCGNGWFSNLIASTSVEHHVIGLDINVDELEQASRVFKKENLTFVYGDIFKLNEHFIEQFDVIVLNASVQYFSNFNELLSLLKTFLKETGEIHIIDSPFYSEKNIKLAKERTKNYYNNLGYPNMAENYFHHSKKLVEEFSVMYKPKYLIIKRLLKKQTNPFYWVKTTK